MTLTAWVVRKAEGLPAARYAIRNNIFRIGRSAENDIVLAEERNVSAYHLEIRNADGLYRIHDLQSTNGTYLNGERISEAVVEAPASIQLGLYGPELTFVLEETATDPDQTLISVPPSQGNNRTQESMSLPAISPEHEKLVSTAVARARRARNAGTFGETGKFMRAMLGEALHQTSRRFRIAIIGLLVALAGVSAFGSWQIRSLKREKRSLDSQMESIEVLLQNAGQNPADTEDLLHRLDQFQGRAKELESTVLYRLLERRREDPVSHEIRSLLAEFGAETYSIPPEFLDQVKRFIERFQGPDRGTTERALGEARSSLGIMRGIFEQNSLPPDLAYMALVESGMNAAVSNPGGAVGWWQFTSDTARHYGLRVDSSIDERKDAKRSTEAASKYIRDLILDFGSGSSVMLALAAYNLGPTRVAQAIHRVKDPIRQRDFWYLYRTRALPVETREYVPKVIAVMIIARHPEQFGF